MSHTENPRDTQFAGFAKLLMEELAGRDGFSIIEIWNDSVTKKFESIIAQRAYDLVYHAIDNSRSNDMEDWYTEQIIPYVPDITKWPEENP